MATVLFADLVGSTAMAGSQDPERTRAVLDRFYDAMAAEIESVGGTVEKFVGDAVMAAFGAPAALEDHAERAVHAALGMQQRLNEMFGDNLSLRIGVNTGEVVVGRPREGSSFVTGDAVNVGARLEQAAEPGSILIGERTAAAVRGAFEVDGPREIVAKGKPDGVTAYAVVRALSMTRPRGVSELGNVFVGRDDDLRGLWAAYEKVVRDGSAYLTTVVGDSGVGKSRLVREVLARMSRERPDTLQRIGRCLSYGKGITYWPLAEILRQHFGLRDTDPPDVVESRLGDHRFLGLTLALDVTDGMHPLAARERLHDSWAEFLTAVAGERPVVVVIEDIHWAEDDLCDLLLALVDQVAGPLLVIATARPELLERRASWSGTHPNRSTLQLNPIDVNDIGRMVFELLGADLPPSMKRVVERAEGNPFFIEELLATLIDRGILRRHDGSWICDDLPPGFVMPDTVHSVLAARIDLLPPAEKAALQAASVIGRVFWTGPVYELVREMSPDFNVLVERDFVRRRPHSSIDGEREYSIKHALTRDVAYASLPKAKRAQLHAGFGDWLERTSIGKDESAALLAHHYAEAARPEDIDIAWVGAEDEARRLAAKASSWSQRAARTAVDRYEIDDALELFHQALIFETDPEKQAALWYEIGVANALKYDGAAFTTSMENAIALGGPAARIYAELGFQTVQRGGMWVIRPDRALVQGWIDKALELSEPGSISRAKALVSQALWADDEGAAHDALRLAEDLKDVDLRSRALLAILNNRFLLGDFEGSKKLSDDRLALFGEISDPDHKAEALFVAFDVYLAGGNPTRAREYVAQHEDLAGGLTPHHHIHGLGNLVILEADTGHFDAVRELIPEVERAVENNLATPCPLNVTSLLYSALATIPVDDREANRLEQKADAIGMKGYWLFDPPRIRIALGRGDGDALRNVLDSIDDESRRTSRYILGPALMDAYVWLGDREQIESLAPRWNIPGSYMEPFVLRALAFTRGDDELMHLATERFNAMDLAWHAGQTERLLSHARSRA